MSIQTASPQEQQPSLESRLLSYLSQSFERSIGSSAELDGDFFEMGLDSLKVVEFLTDVGETLPIERDLFVLLLEHSCLRGLGSGIIQELSDDEVIALSAFLDRQQLG